MLYLVKGITIGLLVAAPLGPVGLLCIRRTISHGRLSGQLSGFGAATTHSLYGMIAGLGLGGISSFLLKSKLVIGVIGGLFLCYLGIKTALVKVKEHDAVLTTHKSKLSHYFSTLALAATNPMTIVSFLGVFAGFGVQSTNATDPLLLIAGIFIGSACWWLALTFTVNLVRHRVSHRGLLLINQVSGVLIFTFGVVALLQA